MVYSFSGSGYFVCVFDCCPSLRSERGSFFCFLRVYAISDILYVIYPTVFMLIEFAWMFCWFLFCFKFSIKLMDSHGSSFLLRLFSEILCYYFGLFKKGQLYLLFCVLSIFFVNFASILNSFLFPTFFLFVLLLMSLLHLLFTNWPKRICRNVFVWACVCVCVWVCMPGLIIEGVCG